MNLKQIVFGRDVEDKANFFREEIFGKSFYALLLSALIPTLHVYFGSMNFFIENLKTFFESQNTLEYYSVLYLFISAFILMGVIPAFVIKFIYKQNLAEYGVKLGDWKLGLKSIGLLFPIITLFFLIPAANQKEIQEFYPLYRPALQDISILINIEFFRGVIYYLAWEFFFRGFILFSLRDYVGDWLAILIQTIPSCLWHIGYPTGEIIMSIPAGIMFGIIAIRTNSIFYVFILHWLIGFTTSLLVFFFI